MNAVGQVAFEQYYYIKNRQRVESVPLFNYTSRENLYIEARYNYEEANTFSFYLGRSFANEGKFSYTVTPLMGVVMGRLSGGSIGVNATLEYQNIFFSTQSQYTASLHERKANFIYAWSELGYQPWKWFYFGLSTQQTYSPEVDPLISAGVFVGFSIGKWTFPVYSFNPMSDTRYFVLGINFSGGAFHRSR